jgi:outer membrane lipoprotein-sorting protein
MRIAPLASACAAAAALTLAAAGSQQQFPTVDEIMQQLSEASSRLDSMVASYRQTEVDEFGDETALTGTFYYVRPSRYKWALEVSGRVVEEMVSNGVHGWRIRHNVKAIDKVTLATVKRRTGGITLTGGADELKENFDIALQGIDILASGQAYHLICTPKDGSPGVDALYRRMELWIDIEQPAPVVRVVIHQKDNIVQTLDFSDIRRNVSVNERMFQYRVPRGYEEITY